MVQKATHVFIKTDNPAKVHRSAIQVHLAVSQNAQIELQVGKLVSLVIIVSLEHVKIKDVLEINCLFLTHDCEFRFPFYSHPTLLLY